MKYSIAYIVAVTFFFGCATTKKEAEVVNTPASVVATATSNPSDTVEIVFSEKKKNNGGYSTTPTNLAIPKSAPVNKNNP